MVSKDDDLSLSRQCTLLSVSRSSLYYKPVFSVRDDDLRERIDAIYTKHPTWGTRRIRVELCHAGIRVSRHKVSQLMSQLGIAAIYRKPNLSKRHPAHEVYPYLLRGVEISKANQVWSTDITYIPLRKGFVYLTAVIDWYSRCVLSWRLSTSLDSSFCIDALKEALASYGAPEVFNTDQGSQFTSKSFIDVLKEQETISISMDGRGRALDNVFVERLWRTVKYEDVYLKGYESVAECRAGLDAFFKHYNTRRWHQALDYRLPVDVYLESVAGSRAA
jgi:putative transposase